MPVITLITLGCAKNLVDSEVVLGSLHQRGYEFTAEPKKADLVIINTCGFIAPARTEAEQVISEFVDWKRDKPGRQLMVIGCYAERFGDYLKVKFPQVDYWSGVRDFDRLWALLEKHELQTREKTFLLDHLTPRVISTGRNWAYVKISEGCSHACRFCSIPLIKGPYQSRSISSIVQEVKNLASLGIKEINLISHDTTYYGRDRKIKGGLVKLLEKLLPVKGLRWIRILYGYPEEITDDLLEIMKEEKICPYFDLPFQHASKKVLKLMGRAMDSPRALKLIEKIRRQIPGAVIRTSLIVGFPGEGIKEFKELKEFVIKAQFSHLGVFTYSPETGTAAASLKETVSPAEKERRRKEIMLLQKEISRKFYRSFVGSELEVLLEEVEEKKGKRIGRARARFQAPEVDGLVLIDDLPDYKDRWPDFLRVKVKKALTYDLRGTLIND
ncbi:MAG: 30S ribosomal protein S12 methylthiotransferase RimO [Candidatus Aminicenantes bacterium]|nr:30S ribosomal protein S12 methylthiotransferase RimO [Candidatus Aminicenantes bacterium]